VPLAEETGLILPLGRFVLHGACREVRRWRSLGFGHLGISVNISAKQLASPTLPDEVAAALAESSLEPSALTLEITESMLLDSHSVIARLEDLKQLGVQIAIDDFGTGYSSLNYLRRFPVDTLKIAKPFVDGIGSSPEQERLASAILRLGRRSASTRSPRGSRSRASSSGCAGCVAATGRASTSRRPCRRARSTAPQARSRRLSFQRDGRPSRGERRRS
jgi:EAL domain-containing protein (putative c-di-GMP-specific phosphodiesterase class I)